MTSSEFHEEGSNLLTAGAFEFVLGSELGRALRSQNFFTLVVVETVREWEGITVTADEGTVQTVAQLIGKEIRETDRLGHVESGALGFVLIDADFEYSARVIDRVIERLESYDFPTRLHITVGAACCPTHALDVESLKRQAMTRPIASWRVGTPPPTAQNSRSAQ
jgi:hypothetical protein